MDLRVVIGKVVGVTQLSLFGLAFLLLFLLLSFRLIDGGFGHERNLIFVF